MPPDTQQETFLVVQFSEQSDYVNAYIFQGTYEQLYRLEHSTWSLEFFLLAADPTKQAGNWGQALMPVGNARSIYQADMRLAQALFHLRQCSPEQRRREMELIRERLDRETRPLTQTLHADTPTGNRQRLEELSIQEMSPEEIARMRR